MAVSLGIWELEFIKLWIPFNAKDDLGTNIAVELFLIKMIQNWRVRKI